MAPVTFEKRKYEKNVKPGAPKRDETLIKKIPALRRPTFSSFPTEQGPIKGDDLSGKGHSVENMAKTLNDTFHGARFNWKTAAASAAAVIGLAAAVRALALARRKRAGPIGKKAKAPRPKAPMTQKSKNKTRAHA